MLTARQARCQPARPVGERAPPGSRGHSQQFSNRHNVCSAASISGAGSQAVLAEVQVQQVSEVDELVGDGVDACYQAER